MIGSGLRASLAIFIVLVPLVFAEGAASQAAPAVGVAAQAAPDSDSVARRAQAEVAPAGAGQPARSRVFVQTFPYATAGQLVPAKLTSVTPGSEYLLKVNGLEQKSGKAKTDKVSRKFRMPDLGGKRHRRTW